MEVSGMAHCSNPIHGTSPRFDEDTVQIGHRQHQQLSRIWCPSHRHKRATAQPQSTPTVTTDSGTNQDSSTYREWRQNDLALTTCLDDD
ncbi:hypothetical protein PIB30_087405 [Stylosanthes scabra]|uniref:Uncharacterized protein n=1 Tax=Stylosanthes scabra TaxID=79078 RepID=A0ABU6RTV1_9FABA|nr:hypothetical protein [Stylosanthes scabra]